MYWVGLSISVCNELSDFKVRNVSYVNCTLYLASLSCLYYSESIIRMVQTIDLQKEKVTEDLE